MVLPIYNLDSAFIISNGHPLVLKKYLRGWLLRRSSHMQQFALHLRLTCKCYGLLHQYIAYMATVKKPTAWQPMS